MIDSFSGRFFFLSNFFCSPVTMYGETYPSVEHAFQAAKVTPGRQGDVTRMVIRKAADRRGRPSPAHAKKLGRRVKLRLDWEEVKLDVMKTLLVRKFEVPELRYLLTCTGSEDLVEGNTWGDDFWGCVQELQDGGVIWRGENHLGRLLMEVRATL